VCVVCVCGMILSPTFIVARFLSTYIARRSPTHIFLLSTNRAAHTCLDRIITQLDHLIDLKPCISIFNSQSWLMNKIEQDW